MDGPQRGGGILSFSECKNGRRCVDRGEGEGGHLSDCSPAGSISQCLRAADFRDLGLKWPDSWGRGSRRSELVYYSIISMVAKLGGELSLWGCETRPQPTTRFTESSKRLTVAVIKQFIIVNDPLAALP